MAEAFYLRSGPDRFRATELTQGPWGPGLQHAGPAAALLGRAVEAHGDRDDLQVTRMTFDIARALPIAELEVATRLLRGGRSVELVEATLAAGGAEGRRATAPRGGPADRPRAGPPALRLPAERIPGPRLPGPEAGRTVPFFPTGEEVGYHTAMEVRFV